MTEIKPCPFCGEEPEIDPCVDMPDGVTLGAQVVCFNPLCPATVGVQAQTEAEAVAAWNTRTPDPSLIAGLREAREALAESREALHFHYVEWDGEPEDAVPLQLARSQCDAAIARLDTLLSQEGQP